MIGLTKKAASIKATAVRTAWIPPARVVMMLAIFGRVECQHLLDVPETLLGLNRPLGQETRQEVSAGLLQVQTPEREELRSADE